MGEGVAQGGGGLRRVLQIAFTIAAVVLIARLVDLQATKRILAAANPTWVALAVGVYAGGQVMSAFRWWLIGRSVGLSGRLRDYVRFYFIGMFFMSFGPSTLGGDFVRGLYLAEGGGRRARAFNSVLFDRLNGLVILVAIGAAAFLIFPRYRVLAPEFALMFWIFSWFDQPTATATLKVLAYLGITNHMENLAKGVIELKDVVFYVSFIAFGLFLAQQSVESQRWRA